MIVYLKIKQFRLVGKCRYVFKSNDFVEFVYILKGSCVHVINGESYPVKRGDMVIINYNQSHSFFGSPGTEFIEILMKPEYINEALINQENHHYGCYHF